MKTFKMNLLAALTALISVFTLSSCLNSDGTSYEYGTAIAKVYYSYTGSYIFKTSNGIIITPTASSISTYGADFSSVIGKVVSITYRWDPDALSIDGDATDISGVELYSASLLSSSVEIVNQLGAANDSVANAPIISLKETSGQYTYEPAFFDETTVLLPINYYISSKSHTFTLVYYPNEENDGTLKLYLRHNDNGDESSTSSTSYNLSGTYGTWLYYHAFNLSNVFARYSDDTGNDYPTTIQISTQENSYSIDLSDSQTVTKIYTVTYTATE